jgi:hypothetical protein
MSQLDSLLRKIKKGSRLLYILGWLNWILFAVCLVSSAASDVQVAGVNAWFKPAKFAASIAIFVWTVAYFIRHLTAPAWAVHLLTRGIATAMTIEIACIVTQAARGLPSHYNVTTPFNFAVFQAMAIMILANTLLMILFFVMICTTDAVLAPAYLWGIRFGAFVFLLASIEGMAMILNQAHTVGAPDGAGLPFLTWSTTAGDLRIAHMLGLHALQVLPLAGYKLSRHGLGVGAVAAVGAAYTAAFVFFFLQAQSARPFIGM